MIGCVTSREIDRLRLTGQLSPLGDDETERLVWTGAVPTVSDVKHRAALGLKSRRETESLLDRIIVRIDCTQLRQRCCYAILGYRRDREADNQNGQLVTMNWDRFGSADRVRGSTRNGRDQKPIFFAEVRARLSVIDSRWSAEDRAFLDQLVLTEATAAWFAKTYQIRSRMTVARGLSVLRNLVDVYKVVEVRSLA